LFNSLTKYQKIKIYIGPGLVPLHSKVEADKHKLEVNVTKENSFAPEDSVMTF